MVDRNSAFCKDHSTESEVSSTTNRFWEQALHGRNFTCAASMTAHGNFMTAEPLAGA
jgi:hypothetical protein